MRALTGLSCSQTGKTGAAGSEAGIGSGGLTALVLRGFRAAELGGGLRLAGAGVGSGAASALDVEALRGLAALTSGAF